MGRIDGFSTVITGGASGMGRSTAELFIAEGAHVVVGDMNKQNGEALVEEMRRASQSDAPPPELEALTSAIRELLGV